MQLQQSATSNEQILKPGAVSKISKNNLQENLTLFGILEMISKFSIVETKHHFLIIIILTVHIETFNEKNIISKRFDIFLTEFSR